MSRIAVIRTVVLAAIALAALGALAARSPSAAAGRSQLVPGKGAWIAGHTDFVGYYRALVDGRWTIVYCVSPDRAAPAAISLRTVSRLPDTSRDVTRQLAQTLAAHGDAQTATHAEAVSQALNEELGNHRAAQRRAPFLAARVQRLATRYVREALARHGPYRLGLHLPGSPLPGQQASGSVTLRAAAGPAPGTVLLRHTGNVRTPRVLHVGRSGQAPFTYRTIAGGPVHLAASARVAPPTLRASRPASGTQLMLTWSAPATVHATATYQPTGPGITHRYACSSQCDGHPLVTISTCAPANRYRSRVTLWFAGQTHRISFSAADTRTCRSWSVVLADGVTVSATWQYRTPGGWTGRLPASGWFTVDCPAPPPVAVLVSYDCNTATVSAALGRQHDASLAALDNRTSHRMMLLITGAVSGAYPVAPGATATVRTFPVDCGSAARLSIRSAIQRAGGGYNYGQPVELTMP